MKKLVIGVVGEIGGGKGAFTEMFIEMMGERPVGHYSISAMLEEILGILGITASRSNRTNLVIKLREAYGDDVLTNAIRRRIMAGPEELAVFDGIRYQTDVDMLRTIEGSKLIYITADAPIRWKRSRLRNQKPGEKDASFEEFLAQEKLPTEMHIPEIGKTADWTIVNNDGLEDLVEQISAFCATLYL